MFGGTLIVHDLARSDEGDYRCIVTLDDGSSVASNAGKLEFACKLFIDRSHEVQMLDFLFIVNYLLLTLLL